MFYLIETPEQIDQLYNKKFSSVFLDIIPLNPFYHPILQKPSLIYLRPLDYKHGFILSVKHNDSLSIKLPLIEKYLNSLNEIIVPNKKIFLYTFPELNNIQLDLNFGFFLTKKSLLNTNDYNLNIHKSYYSRHNEFKNINSLIPLVKHYEKYENIFSNFISKYEEIKSVFDSSDYRFLNKKMVSAFFEIEKNGLKINLSSFKEYYKISNINQLEKDSIVYSQYNLYNTTLRPSNNFYGINFAALNKDNGERKLYESRNDYLIEFDYKSFHINLLLNLIKPLKTPFISDIHTELGKIYFNKSNLTPEEYKLSKQKTFKILYTDEIKKYTNIEFFSKVKEYKDDLWDFYKRNGYINAATKLTEISYITQILPYVLQNYETFHNVSIILKLNKLLKDKKTKLILYTYDSFLFDFSEHDGINLIEDIRNILEEDGFKCGIKQGKNMHSMVSL